MVFVDNDWMTRLSGCISVSSILRNTEHHWSCIGRYTNLYNNQRVHSSFSLVENRDLLEDRRTADAISVTNQSQPFPNYQQPMACFVL